MKLKLLVVMMLLCTGCVTRQQLDGWTSTLNEVVPAIREVQAASGQSSAKLDKVLSDVERVSEAVATAETPLEAAEKGWDASKPFNPYYGYGVAALGLWRLWQKKKESDNSLEEVVFGIEDAKKNGNGTAALKDSLNASNSITTRKKVAKILA